MKIVIVDTYICDFVANKKIILETMAKEENPACYENFLSAQELFKNRGLRCAAWEKWEKASHVIPKTGSKQFEPSGSWIENNTLENGINTRKDLIALGKVDRVSQLAVAQWVPAQKKAMVTKKSGVDLGRFGHSISSTMYLYPEEALLLLEMNNLELYWNGVPLSVQQAYTILFDNEFTSDHYLVYSQLTRHGYYLQRNLKKPFHESRTVGKKVIKEPENGLRMSKNPSNSDEEEDESKQPKPETLEICAPKPENQRETAAETQVTKNTNGDSKNLPIVQETPKNSIRKKAEIISDETFLDPVVKIELKKPSGSRIQRNVKLLPKRCDQNFKKAEKRAGTVETSMAKKCRQEVIDISDDEIQEIPRPMTRMEILNTLPNIAARPVTTIKICKDYIPKGVEPQKNVYEYRRSKWSNFHKMESQNENQASASCSSNGQQVVPFQPQSYPQVEPFFGPRTLQSSSSYQGFVSERISQQSWFERNTFVQQNFCQVNQRNMWSRTFYQSMFNTNPVYGTVQNFMRSMQFSSYRFRNVMHPAFRYNFQYLYQQNTRLISHGNHGRGSSLRDQNFHQNNSHQRSNRRPSTEIVEVPNDDYVPSFTKIPNVSSWSELKAKWQEEKTITIDDEEPNEINDGDIQVVEHSVKPLLKPVVAMNFEEIFEKLRIIKSAPEKNARLKKTDYFAFFNVYSNVKLLKKANPGNPMCRLLIIRAKNERQFDTAKLSRLQDSKDAPIVIAYVSNSSISYLQIGLVSLPNLI